jgi:hypothetical protein
MCVYIYTHTLTHTTKRRCHGQCLYITFGMHARLLMCVCVCIVFIYSCVFMCVYAPTTSIIELHAPPPEGVNNNKRGHTQTAILCVWSRARVDPNTTTASGGQRGTTLTHNTHTTKHQPNQRTRESLAHDNSRRAHPTVHASIMMMMMMMIIISSSSSSSITSAHTSPHNLRPCHTTTHVVVVW